MKRASSTPLPSSISALRLVAWGVGALRQGEEGILDVCEFNTAAQFRKSAKQFADMTAARRSVEIVSENPSLRVSATVEKGIPEGCRSEQVCIKLLGSDDSAPAALLSLDRFWDLLCETAAEMTAK